MPNFYTVVTENGLRSLALATTQGKKLSLTHAVVGDGNGKFVIPTKDKTSLEHEVWRGTISGVQSVKTEPNTSIFEFVIKADVGGFTIREVGLLDEDSKLFCIGNFPETEKPVVTDGSVRDLVIRLPLHFENAESVNLIVDTNVAVATKQDLLDHNADPLAHGIMKSDAVDLDSSEKVATSKAIKTTYDSLSAHKADTSAHGIVKSDAVNSASSDFATSMAVKTVNDQLTQHAANVDTHASATTSAKGFVRLGTASEHVAHTAQNTAATPYGVWKLIEAVKSDDTSSSSSIKLATSKAVKNVRDLLTAHAASVNTHDVATTSAKGFVRFATDNEHKQRSLKSVATSPWGVWKLIESIKSDAITLSSSVTLATAKAVKTLNDALEAHKTTAMHMPAGHIYLVPFPPGEMPQHHYLPNGEGLLRTSQAGKRLRSMSSAYKSAWGITENSTHVFLPNLFGSNGDGYFFRPVNGVNRKVGNKQGDAIRNITGEFTATWAPDNNGNNIHYPVGNSYAADYLTGAFKEGKKIAGATSYRMYGNTGLTSGACGLAFDASRIVPTAHENRPVNIGMLPAIYLPPM